MSWEAVNGKLTDLLKEETKELDYWELYRFFERYGQFDPLFKDGLSIYTKEEIGARDENSEFSLILSVTDSDNNETFWRVPGFYSSYNDIRLYLEQIHEVRQTQQTITTWS